MLLSVYLLVVNTMPPIIPLQVMSRLAITMLPVTSLPATVITPLTLKELGLAVGTDVTAIVKATEVMVMA